jgi:hypothetical protein
VYVESRASRMLSLLDLGKSVRRKLNTPMGSLLDVGSCAGESQYLTCSDVQQSVVPLRVCVSCATKIPANRLAARPFATQCVPCLTAAGDVKPIRRYDETVGEETVSTYFITNKRIEDRIARLSSHVPSARAMAEATDAPTVEMKRPEQEMERRAGDTLTALINETTVVEEEVNEGD